MMKLLWEHPLYGKKIPFLCRIRLHWFYKVWNAGWREYYTYKCINCGWETE